MLRPAAFVGIDWSGAKGARQQGIQLARAQPGFKVPERIVCPDGRQWGRAAVFDWLVDAAERGNRGRGDWGRGDLGRGDKGPVLVGIDFAFAHPFVDLGAYYPHTPLEAQPRDPAMLWQMIETICSDDPHLYGGRVFATPPFADYYLSPHNHGAPHYASRRRITETAARAAGRSPSPTFKAIGADNVATGSMAGMRLLHRLKARLGSRLAIWPFDRVEADNWSGLGLILVEIFPSLYFHAAGFNPAGKAAADPGFLSAALGAYGSAGVVADFRPQGKDADEADAMIAAAALRYFAGDAGWWHQPQAAATATATATGSAALSEGWIFGVGTSPPQG